MASLFSTRAALQGLAKVRLASRVEQLAAEEELRLACHLIETAVAADPVDNKLHGIRVAIYQQRVMQETSLMAKGIFW